MRNGFIFDHDRCVACKACSAACMLENGWKFGARNIYTPDSTGYLPHAVINLSMACNHCSEPACLIGCPSNAYFRDKESGAIIINPVKCLGCRYCTWNCPYDAPKFNEREGIIEKCHYCFQRQEEGLEPACSSACPTGALSFGPVAVEISHNEFSWMPERRLNPSLEITGKNPPAPLRIIPERTIAEYPGKTHSDAESKGIEWSLLLFSFLSIISVSHTISGIFNENYKVWYLPVVTIISAAVISVLHLGNKKNLLRSVSNPVSSPLSREILLLSLYAILIITDHFIVNRILSLSTSVAGLILLFAIDNVYSFSSAKRSTRLHSGQAFISGLLISSYLIHAYLPFLFIAVLKFISLFYISSLYRENLKVLPVRVIRIALLIIMCAVVVSDSQKDSIEALVVLISGELLDRFLFYNDFNPENIKDSIKEIINNPGNNEKKGS